MVVGFLTRTEHNLSPTFFLHGPQILDLSAGNNQRISSTLSNLKCSFGVPKFPLFSFLSLVNSKDEKNASVNCSKEEHFCISKDHVFLANVSK